MNNICIYIISHGRANKVQTLKTLIKQNCTIPIYIVCSSDDKELFLYQEKYKDLVLVFDKKKYEYLNTMDNFQNQKIAIYAREACFDFAKEQGYKYFYQFDDDYTTFSFKFKSNGFYKETKIKNITNTLFFILDFFAKTNIQCVAMAQNGDFIGGGSGSMGEKIYLKRKAMNTFLFKTDNKISFIGSMNADVNTYLRYGNIGNLYLQVNQVSINQETTQKNKNGLTDIYKQYGTYVKSFYSVMINPSAVKISLMGTKHRRLHHKINNNKAYPLILSENGSNNRK